VGTRSPEAATGSDQEKDRDRDYSAHEAVRGQCRLKGGGKTLDEGPAMYKESGKGASAKAFSRRTRTKSTSSLGQEVSACTKKEKLKKEVLWVEKRSANLGGGRCIKR